MWMARVERGRLRRLENGRRGSEVASLLQRWALRDPRLVVGLDFAFSLPGWWLRERGLTSAPELWDLAAAEGETWLANCAPPFWGRGRRARPDLGGRSHFRQTDLSCPPTAGIRPKSGFQIGGAGAVGTAAIRGMPVLAALRRAGFSIWPFDPPRWPLVVEIYPRLLTGPVRKSSRAAREVHLSTSALDQSPALRARAGSSPDAFDAAVSALVMSRYSRELVILPTMTDEVSRLEGEIWHPNALRPGQPDFELALSRSVQWHRTQRRKGKPEVPYVGHLMGVAAIVIEAGGDVTLATAALLHDTLEDQPEQVNAELLAREFGPRVASIVEECSDSEVDVPGQPRDQTSWLGRKQRYIESLKDASLDAVKVSLADKLYNARAIRTDHAVLGPAFWEPFNAGADAQLSYYRGLVRAFRSRTDLQGRWRQLVEEMDETVEAMAQGR